MEFSNINHFAVITCAVLNLLLGALWYSPALFYEAWKQENKLTDDDFKAINFAKMYTIAFIIALIMSYNMALFLAGSETDWSWGLTAGFLTGFGWCAMIFTTIANFELRSKRYIFINGGYIVIYFSLIGLILGAWQ